MKKEYYLYPLFFTLSAITNYYNALTIPGVYVRCPCFWNNYIDFSIFPGSVLVSFIILFVVYKLSKRGMSYTKSFLISFLLITFLFSVFNILVLILDSNFHFFQSYYHEKSFPSNLLR